MSDTTRVSGILETQVGKIILSEDFLNNLKPDVRQAWKRLYGHTVQEYLMHSLVQYLGAPLNDLIR